MTFHDLDHPIAVWITELVFFAIWEWTSHQDSMPGCAENVVNTMVFIRFPVLRKLEVLVSRGGFGCHLEGFW